MKIEEGEDSNPKRTGRLWALLFTMILIGTVFVITVEAPFDPPHSDYGDDTDGDVDYNYLIVDVTVTVSTPGDYVIDAVLEDSTISWIEFDTNFTYLDPGTHVVQIRFEGWLIRQNGVNGPFTVYLDLYDDSWTLLDSNMHNTTNYKYTDFELPPAKFLPEHTDYGLDTDSDGDFNYLVVNVTVDVDEAGFYEVQGDLLDDLSNKIDSAENHTFLSTGSQVVQLYFYGPEIFKSSEDGPYTVNLDLYDDSMNWMDSDTYSTKFYTHTQFQPPNALFKPPHSDYGLDTDSDGLFNYLVVNMTINVTVAGTYNLEGYLFDGFSMWIDTESNETFLDVGIHVVQLFYSSINIYKNGEDGPYTVDCELFDDLAYLLDSDIYTTNFYALNQFQPPPALFDVPHSDYGLDTDSDGFFNYLVVNVTVNVNVAGNFIVDGELNDLSLNFIEQLDNFTFLNTGIQVVQLYFRGSAIYTNGEDGLFVVFLELFDGLFNSLDLDMYFTGSYTYDQFQPAAPPQPPQPPTGLQASLYNDKKDVMLSWNASLDDGAGEDDVTGYTVYKSTTGVGGPYNFAAWIDADDSPSYNWIDTDAGYQDPNDYFYIVRANDTSDLEEQNAIKVGKVANYLLTGWNLISIPLIQTNTSMGHVLQTLNVNYSALQGYHAGRSRPWLHWQRDKPNYFNDEIEMNRKEGYYILMTSSDYLVVTGKVPTTTQIPLSAGWNLVGYPHLVDRTRSDALSSISGKYNAVYEFDPVIGRDIPIQASDTMSPSCGYWIHATEDCIWEI